MFAPLQHWHEFYLLLGTAAGALVALQFVAVSVGVGFLSNQSASASRTFLTPVIVHFTAVLLGTALALVPWHSATTIALGIGLASAIGLIYSAVLSLRVFKDTGEHVEWDDRLCHGILPPIGYAAGVAAAVMFRLGAESAAAVLAAALLLLLLVNIRNAWDTILYLVRRQTDSRPPPDRPA
jgi:hypothetical protein